MPHQASERWNDRYLHEKRFATFNQPRSFLVENALFLPRTGFALDVAMGLGGNAGFLLGRGLHVVGVDISSIAVRRAKDRFPQLMAVIGDLTHFRLLPGVFDVILNFYYLQRDLWSAYRNALSPGGVLFIETLTQEMRQINPEIDPSYLLEAGELRRAFLDWEILVYRESWIDTDGEHSRPVSSLVVRRPA